MIVPAGDVVSWYVETRVSQVRIGKSPVFVVPTVTPTVVGHDLANPPTSRKANEFVPFQLTRIRKRCTLRLPENAFHAYENSEGFAWSERDQERCVSYPKQLPQSTRRRDVCKSTRVVGEGGAMHANRTLECRSRVKADRRHDSQLNSLPV